MQEQLDKMGISELKNIEIANSLTSKNVDEYIDYMYNRTYRSGLLRRDCIRMVKTDRNIFSSCMLALCHGDVLVSGLTRSYYDTYDEIRKVIDRQSSATFGMSILLAKGRTVFISDTTIHELPTSEQLADIAIQTARRARELGHEPRVALLSYSNFGNPMKEKANRIREAMQILNQRDVDFEFDGEMSVDVALNPEIMKQHYPFCKLSGPANVLIMPALHSANISSKLMQELGGGVVIGPILTGLAKPVQILPLGATVSDILKVAAFGAVDAIRGFKPIMNQELVYGGA